MLVMMGYNYDSEDALDLVSYITEFIAYYTYLASIDLAKEKGSFLGLDRDAFIQSGFLQKHCNSYKFDWNEIIKLIKEYGIRNARLLSVAPTGTMSLVFGNNCSSGIEPIFSLEYDRRVEIGGQQEEDSKIVKVQDYSYHLYNDVIQWNRRDDAPFVTALDISVDDHIDMLATVAYNVDMSVSKTINVPEDYPFEKCKNIYRQCWKKGIKGCTIFRPNPLRQGVLLESKKQDKEIVKCKDNLVGIKRKIMTGCGSMHVMAWYDPDTKDILEVFIGRGSSGGCEKNLLAMARLISLSLRGGIPLEKVIDQLDSCGGCSAYQARRVSKKDTSPGSSCSTAIARVLIEISEQLKGKSEDKKIKEFSEQIAEETLKFIGIEALKCPECGTNLTFEGGCNICKSCGWSKCG